MAGEVLIEKLRHELGVDPERYGYAEMSDAEIEQFINAKNIQKDKKSPHISRGDLIGLGRIRLKDITIAKEG